MSVSGTVEGADFFILSIHKACGVSCGIELALITVQGLVLRYALQ